MNEEAMLRKRVGGWRRLEELTIRAEGGFRRLSGLETVEFVRLYRKASADLASLATQTSNVEVTSYLNSIVTRAYGQLYKAPSKPFFQVLSNGVLTGAQVFRRNAWAFLLSLAITLAGVGFAFTVMSSRPDLREYFVPASSEELFTHWKEGKHERRGSDESIGAAALYATNNPRVGIMANAVSIATFGVLTSYLLWTNGTMIGALAADMASVGKLGFLLSSIAPHGVSEIGGILVTAAGGFVMARALISPGRRSRGHALRLAGKDSFVLLLVGLVMIAIAAPIEGFFSFNPAVPQGVKVFFAVVALIGWTGYFVGYGKGLETEPVALDRN